MSDPFDNALRRLIREIHSRSLDVQIGEYPVLAVHPARTPLWVAGLLMLGVAACGVPQRNDVYRLSAPYNTPFVLLWLYAQSGQLDRYIELFEDFVRQGAPGRAAYAHGLYASDLLGDDPRYQALLEEAGITW